MTPQERTQALAQIAEEVRSCTKCPLHAAGRIQTVPGYGDVNAEILFIGEAPGEQEDKRGLPFVGRSGQYLDYLLDKIGLKRSQVFIANVIKCRPPSNRDPMPDEILACKPYLERQIAIIDPLVIATLGRFSMGLFFLGGKITAIHGKPRYDDRRAYYPFFHPAAVLRNPDLRRDMEADFQRLLQVVAEVKRRRAQTIPPNETAPAMPNDEEPPENPIQLRLFE